MEIHVILIQPQLCGPKNRFDSCLGTDIILNIPNYNRKAPAFMSHKWEASNKVHIGS